MKHSLISLLALICLANAGNALAQQPCSFNIVGTWQGPATSVNTPALYRFDAKGTVTVLRTADPGANAPLPPGASAAYELDNPSAPKLLTFKASGKAGPFGDGQSALEIAGYDDASFVGGKHGAPVARWQRVDADRYFLILVARKGEFYDQSGSAFPILIRLSGGRRQIDAAGTYSAAGKRAFGEVPPEIYRDFLKEPQNESAVMLRLEINSQQYERALAIVHTWERRARNGELLYPNEFYLNNVLLVKAVTETLNQCGEEIKLYKLNYLHPEDWITDKYSPGFIPFVYFSELRRLNEPLHVRDDKFAQLAPASAPAPGQ